MNLTPLQTFQHAADELLLKAYAELNERERDVFHAYVMQRATIVLKFTVTGERVA